MGRVAVGLTPAKYVESSQASRLRIILWGDPGGLRTRPSA
jgi:hypothetical protein